MLKYDIISIISILVSYISIVVTLISIIIEIWNTRDK